MINTLFNVTNMIMGLLILVGILLIAEIFHIISKIQYNKRESELEKYNIEINTDIDEKAIALLEKIIDREFGDYIVLQIEYKKIIYIDSKLEQKMNKDIAHQVSQHISPLLITKLSAYYNDIGDIIAKKVYMRVLNYTIAKNQPKEAINPRSK